MTYSLIELAPGEYELSMHDTVVAKYCRELLNRALQLVRPVAADQHCSKQSLSLQETKHSFSLPEELSARPVNLTTRTSSQHNASRDGWDCSEWSSLISCNNR
jgi:hypothetical protein